MTLKLPLGLRKKLKRPIGKIRTVTGKEKFKKLVTVGDLASYEFLKKGITPHLIIYDGKIMRKKADKKSQDAIKSVKADMIEIKNPAGTIQEEVWAAIELGLKRRTKIKVTGEEDLLVMPVVLLAKKGTTVCYGQPRKGIVFVKVTEKVKTNVKETIERMEVI
jgi:uncharacterized protein (UPF0218 family)